MTYKGYKADIKFDSDANTFFGEILNSSAVIHFRGNSIEELEKSFKEGIDEYLEVCKEEGISPERPFSGEFRVRISPELHKKIFLQAKKSNLSINKFAIQAFEEKVLSTEKSTLSSLESSGDSIHDTNMMDFKFLSTSDSEIDTQFNSGESGLDSTNDTIHFPKAVE